MRSVALWCARRFWGTACAGDFFGGVGEEVLEVWRDGRRVCVGERAGGGLRERAAFDIVADDAYRAFRDVAGDDVRDKAFRLHAVRRFARNDTLLLDNVVPGGGLERGLVL